MVGSLFVYVWPMNMTLVYSQTWLVANVHEQFNVYRCALGNIINA